MKALVTGGAGFIGSHVVDSYVRAGWEVVVVDDLSTGHRSNINPAVKFYEVDIRSPEIGEIFRHEKPTVLNHHAAQMSVRISVAEPIRDADINILGTLNLLEQARQHGIERIVYISSGGAVYGEPEYLPCDEEHPVHPICQYGASKHTVEHYLYMYHLNYGMSYAVLRYPNVYGPRQDPEGEAGVVAIFTGQMLSDAVVVINGDGEQSRDFVFVEDCASANLLLSEPSGPVGIYNLGSGEGTSINTIFASLKDITGYRQQAKHGPAKLGETYQIFLDASKAQEELGWEKQINLHDGLVETVEYFKHQTRQTEKP